MLHRPGITTVSSCISKCWRCQCAHKASVARQGLDAATVTSSSSSSSSSTATRPFWLDVKEDERKWRTAPPQPDSSKKSVPAWKQMRAEEQAAAGLDFNFLDGSTPLPGTGKKKKTRHLADLEGGAPLGIEAVEAPPEERSVIAKAAMPLEYTPLQEKLLAARSPGALLTECLPLLRPEEHSLVDLESSSQLPTFALALQALIRWTGEGAGAGSGRNFRHDRRLLQMLDALASDAATLEPWAVVSALRGLSHLRIAHPSATESLIGAARELQADMSAEQVSLVFQSLALTTEIANLRPAVKLREELLIVLNQRSGELQPRSIAQLLPALLRLRVTDATLNGRLAEQMATSAMALRLEDVAAASHAFCALRTVHPPLLERAQAVLEQGVHGMTPRAVVQMCSALAEGESEEPFQDQLMPAVRSFLHHYNARDICRIGEAFTRIGAADPDFMAELAQSLEARTEEMGSHEISVALNIFSSVAYALPRLMPGLVAQLQLLVEELSPRQLARCMRGLSDAAASGDHGASDARLWRQLRERAQRLETGLYGGNAVDILLALTQANHLDEASLKSMLSVVQRQLRQMNTNDFIAVLYTVSQLPGHLQERVPPTIVEEALFALRRRGYGPWRAEADALIHLLQALRSLRLQDEELFELALDRLPTALRSPSVMPLHKLVQLLELLGDLPPKPRLHVRMHLHQRTRLRAALREALIPKLKRKLDIESQTVIVRALARLGYDDPIVQDWLDRVVAVAEPELECSPPEVACELLAALAELNWQRSFCRDIAGKLLRARYPDWAAVADGAAAPLEGLEAGSEHEERTVSAPLGGLAARPEHEEATVSGALEAKAATSSSPSSLAAAKLVAVEAVDEEKLAETSAEESPQDLENPTWSLAADPLEAESLLRLGWALAVLNEPVPMPLFEEAHLLLEGELPADWSGSSLARLQQLALHWTLSTSEAQRAEAPEEIRNWLELAMEVPREDLYSRQQAPRPERRERQVKVPSTPYEQWLSIALAQLHIPHVAGMRVAKIHRAAVAFPRQKQLIDVLDQIDLSTPSFRTLGSAELRRRQFAQLGWAVHPADLRDLHHAMRSGTLKLLVSKMLRSLDPDAARRTYRTDARPGNYGGIRIVSRPPKELLDSDDEGEEDDDPSLHSGKFKSPGSGGWKSATGSKPRSRPSSSSFSSSSSSSSSFSASSSSSSSSSSFKGDLASRSPSDPEEPIVKRTARQELHLRAKRAAAKASAELEETSRKDSNP